MSENVAWSTSNILSEKKSSLDVHSWRLKPTLREIRPLDKLVNPIQHWLTKQLTKHYLQRKKNVASFLRDVISGNLFLKKMIWWWSSVYIVLWRKMHTYALTIELPDCQSDLATLLWSLRVPWQSRQNKYRTRAIISRGLYIFTPFLVRFIMKFRFSEKTTKIWPIFHL